MPELVISLNKQIIKRLQLAEAKYLFGRSEHCDVVLNERMVSAEHAQLVRIGDECFLEDLHSTNGVYVNQVRTHKHLLLNKDLIQIGKYELLFHAITKLDQTVDNLCLETESI
ncbi:FHA domain-containing protein [uncultured Thiothrix sp.]|uniref:FHA domain-containing protein n=1 Tax=uncultured Thiothrix sp. TaxID=223185 RepID=UPI00260B4570|nr:FHA domain-containing protein [uncultured Thiothrix sp.]